MGLRTRLVDRLRRALRGDAVPAAPAPVPTPTPASQSRLAPVAAPIAPARAPEAPLPTVASPAPAPVPPPAPAPAVPSPPAAPAALAAVLDRPATDAPVRGAHLPPRVQAASGAAVDVEIATPALGLALRFPVEPGERVLDAAERAGHELPSSCRSGGCLSCSALLLAPADTEMEEQYVLDDDHIAAGYRLLCITTLRSPARFRTHVQDEIL